MKFLLSAMVLTLNFNAEAFFHCFSNANEHVKLKEKKLKATPNVNFLDTGTNCPKAITLHLRNDQNHFERFFLRSIPTEYFKKSGQWELKITSDATNSLEIQDLKIMAPEAHGNQTTYKWLLSPKKSGLVLLEARYTDNTRTEPYRQSILVTIE